MQTPDTSRPFETWLDQNDDVDIEYASYWNDEEADREKPWNVVGLGFEPMERYLDEVGLPADLELSLDALRRTRGRGLSGVGIDVAAGNMWAAPRLLAEGRAERLYCLEYSRHRLLKLGPAVLDHYGVPEDAVVLVWGSFYELRLAESSLDFALLSQAFHHADRPDDLLRELRRVLKPDGVILILGEHVVGWRTYASFYLNLALSVLPSGIRRRLGLGVREGLRRTLVPGGADLYPPDPESGDHEYTLREYGRIFKRHGFEHVRIRRRGAIVQSFVLTPR